MSESKILRMPDQTAVATETSGICPTENFNGEGDGFAGNLPWLVNYWDSPQGTAFRTGGEVYLTRPAPAHYSSSGIFQARMKRDASENTTVTATFGHMPTNLVVIPRSASSGEISDLHSADASVFVRMEELDDFDYWGETDEELFLEGIYSGYEFCVGNTTWFDWSQNTTEVPIDLSAMVSASNSSGGFTVNTHHGSYYCEYSSGWDAHVTLGDLTGPTAYTFIGTWNGTPGNASLNNLMNGFYCAHYGSDWVVGLGGWYTSNGSPINAGVDNLATLSGDPSGLEFRVRLESNSEGPDVGYDANGLDVTSPNYGRLRLYVGGVLVYDNGPGTYPESSGFWNTLTVATGNARYPTYVDGGVSAFPVSSGFSWTQIQSGQPEVRGFCFMELWTTRGGVPFFGGIDFMDALQSGDTFAIKASGPRETAHITCYINDTVAMDFDVANWEASAAEAANAINPELGVPYYSGGSLTFYLPDLPFGKKGGVQMFASAAQANGFTANNWTEATNRLFSLDTWEICGSRAPAVGIQREVRAIEVDLD